MATRKPVVLIAGQLSELPDGDTIPAPEGGNTIVTVSAASTIDATTDVLIVTATANSIQTLPPLATSANTIITIRNNGTAKVTVKGNGAENIELANTIDIFPKGAVTILNDTTSWIKLSTSKDIFETAYTSERVTPYSAIASSGGTTTVPNTITFFPGTTAITAANTNATTKLFRIRAIPTTTAGSLCWTKHSTGFLATLATTSVKSWFFNIVFAVEDTVEVAGARMFVGLNTNTGNPTNVEPDTILNAVGLVQLSTDNTQLYLMYSNATTVTTIPLGTQFPAADATTPIRLEMVKNTANTTIYVRVTNLSTNQIYCTALTGTLPVSTANLVYQGWRCNNTTAAQIVFSFSQLQMSGIIL